MPKNVKNFPKVLKSPIFIIAVILLLLFTGIGVGGYFLFDKASKFNEQEAIIPPEVLVDVLPCFYDEEKCNALIHAEMTGLEAAEACRAHNYEQMHSGMETCENELINSLGEKTPLVSFAMYIHAGFEQRFSRWDVVEGLERRILANLPSKKAYDLMRESCRARLVDAVEFRGNFPEALKLRLEDLALAVKAKDGQASKIRSCCSQLEYLYWRFHFYDRAVEMCDRTLAVLNPAKENDDCIVSVSPGIGSMPLRWVVMEDKVWILAQANRLKEAEAVFDSLITKFPNTAYYYSERGYLKKYYSQDYAEAISDYSQAIILAEKYRSGHGPQQNSGGLESFYMRRAVARSLSGNLEMALTDASMALSQSKSPYFFDYARRGEIYSLLGKYKLAETDFEKSLKILPTQSYAPKLDEAAILKLRGDNSMRAGRYEDALASYDLVVKSAVDDPIPYIARALALEKIGRKKDALNDFGTAANKLTQFEPGHREMQLLSLLPERPLRMALQIYEGRAHVYDSLKEPSLAAADRAKAKELRAKIKAVQCI